MPEPTRVVQIGDDGKVTLSMPDLVGRYLIVEQRDGHIILSPYDLRWQAGSASIAKLGSRLHVVQFNGACPVA